MHKTASWAEKFTSNLSYVHDYKSSSTWTKKPPPPPNEKVCKRKMPLRLTKKTADKITKQVQITLREQFTVKSNGTDLRVTESLKYKTA